MQIDRNLNFSEYAFIMQKSCQTTISPCEIIRFHEHYRRVLMNYFIDSQFDYCPLKWMLHGRQVNNKTNHLHERWLSIVYKDNNGSFKDLLNPFFPNTPFLYPLKISENLTVIWCFQGIEKRCIGDKWVKKDNSFTVHHRNIQSLTIELFKVKENLWNEWTIFYKLGHWHII